MIPNQNNTHKDKKSKVSKVIASASKLKDSLISREYRLYYNPSGCDRVAAWRITGY